MVNFLVRNRSFLVNTANDQADQGESKDQAEVKGESKDQAEAKGESKDQGKAKGESKDQAEVKGEIKDRTKTKRAAVEVPLSLASNKLDYWAKGGPFFF